MMTFTGLGMMAMVHIDTGRAVLLAYTTPLWCVLAGVFAVPLDLLFQRRNGEGFGQGDAAVGFETGDKLPGCHIQVRAGTVLFELERLPVTRLKHRGIRFLFCTNRALGILPGLSLRC